MASKRDYYEVLGLEKSAGDQEIKRAYRKMAMKYHPDRNPGDAKAEELFKEAAEAYSVLSDSEKRSIYDRFGHQGLAGSGGAPGFGGMEDIFSNFGDIFGDLFGFGFGRGGGAGRHRGEDLSYALTIDFEEAVFGTSKDITIKRDIPCEKCSGTGAMPGSSPKRCSHCNGSGEVMHGQGLFLIRSSCPSCQGTGQTIDNPCDKCNGRGLKSEKKKIKVDIPQGFDEGMTLRYAGHGSHRTGSGVPGDLYIKINVRPHKIFHRKGNDLIAQLDVNYAVCALGGEIIVPTLEEDETITIKAGSQFNDILTIKGKGVPQMRGNGRGSIHYVINIPVPKKLSSKQKELLEELSETFDRKAQTSGKKKKSKGFFGF